MSYLLWQSANTVYELYGKPLEFKIINAPPQLKEEATQIFGARLRPYRLLKQGALVAGGLSGLVLAIVGIKQSFLKKDALRKAPLAPKEEL